MEYALHAATHTMTATGKHIVDATQGTNMGPGPEARNSPWLHLGCEDCTQTLLIFVGHDKNMINLTTMSLNMYNECKMPKYS